MRYHVGPLTVARETDLFAPLPSWRATAGATVAAVVLLAPLAAAAESGTEIGDARTIVSIVKADFDKEERELTIGDIVRQDEVIEVSQDGRGEFRLNDDTKLALGPGARMVLDKFVYDSDKKTGSIILDLTKGAFRFITGVASKPTYLIRTPNAAITVRGTIFDVYVLPDDSAWLLLHEGAVEVTSQKNVCHVLDRAGSAYPNRQRRLGQQAAQLERHARPRRRRLRRRFPIRRRHATADRAGSADDALGRGRCRVPRRRAEGLRQRVEAEAENAEGRRRHAEEEEKAPGFERRQQLRSAAAQDRQAHAEV